jgi:hypothetical protein
VYELLTPVPPYAALIKLPFHVPDVIVPTVVKLEVTTAEPRVVAFRTDVLLILNALPVGIFQS